MSKKTHILRSVAHRGPAVLPPNGETVLFDENGLSEPVDEETAQATVGVPGFVLEHILEPENGQETKGPLAPSAPARNLIARIAGKGNKKKASPPAPSAPADSSSPDPDDQDDEAETEPAPEDCVGDEDDSSTPPTPPDDAQ